MQVVLLVVKTMTYSSDDLRQRIDYVKSTINARFLVESLGFDIVKDTGKELRAACKAHGGDNTSAFRFNKDNNTWQCFTHKCHEVYGYDIIGLVRSCNNVSFTEALKYLENMVGGGSEFLTKGLKARIQRNDDRFVNGFGDAPLPRMVNEDSLEQFKHFRSDRFIKDGFKKETLDYFEIAGGYTDSHGVIRDIIPIRDLYGDLVAYSLRDIRDGSNNDFKYIITKGFDKDSVLYNFNKVKHLCETKPLIVVEGFKSVWRLYEYGIENVVCVMGSDITVGQLSLLNVYATSGVIIMFDNDSAGVTGCIKAVENLKKEMPDVSIVPVFITEVDDNGKGLDPSDLSKDVIHNYLGKMI